MNVSTGTIALLAVLAAIAGCVDAIGGGGGLLTVPALLSAWLPPHLTLGTNKGVSTWGTAAATVTFARRGKLRAARGLLGFACGAAGAVVGARAQLAFSAESLNATCCRPSSRSFSSASRTLSR